MISNTFSEKDWKYLKRIKDEMLSTYCFGVNKKVAEIVYSTIGSEHSKYRALYKYLHEADEVLGLCFNDWRRSSIAERVFNLHAHGLLKEEHLARLSEVARSFIKRCEDFSGAK